MQLKTLKQKCDFQDEEIEKLQKKVRDASLFATDQSNKCQAAKEAIRSFTTQLKEIMEKLPPEVRESETFKAVQSQALTFIEASENEASESQTSLPVRLQPEQQSVQESEATSTKGSKIITLDASVMGDLSQGGESLGQYADPASSSDPTEANQVSKEEVQDEKEVPSSEASESATNQGTENEAPLESKQPTSVDMDSVPNQGRVTGVTPPQASTSRSEGSKESIEQFAPGVYITYIQLRNGTKVFRRVRFSKRKFAETQAEEWWKKNRERVLRKYIPPPQNNATSPTLAPSPPPPASASPLPSDQTSEDSINKISVDESKPTSSTA
ncbi:hypothetical protein Cgig2_022113 [Carnegiea gigantea]|uniref:BRX domain-containing protein n=1 Tax=Carnegiea gigantea TaxID=171969 RepID=A0A9Q1QAU4_9CARY|nr:hypothetical protein Cgig2_022113 [Carnegiea gigantea]